MCMCKAPNINGQPGYSWDGKSIGIRPISAPELLESDVLIYDEPGRCGGQDSHCHHIRFAKALGCYAILVRHGGGDERLEITGYRPGTRHIVEALAGMDSTARYWTLLSLYYIHRESADNARREEESRWKQAIAAKHIKVRRSKYRVTVEITQPEAIQCAR